LIGTRSDQGLGHNKTIYKAGIAQDNDLGKRRDNGRSKLSTGARLGNDNVLTGIEKDNRLTIVLALTVWAAKVLGSKGTTAVEFDHHSPRLAARAIEDTRCQIFKVFKEIRGQRTAQNGRSIVVVNIGTGRNGPNARARRSAHRFALAGRGIGKGPANGQGLVHAVRANVGVTLDHDGITSGARWHHARKVGLQVPDGTGAHLRLLGHLQVPNRTTRTALKGNLELGNARQTHGGIAIDQIFQGPIGFFQRARIVRSTGRPGFYRRARRFVVQTNAKNGVRFGKGKLNGTLQRSVIAAVRRYNQDLVGRLYRDK
jgi:hypothetical protein